MNIRITKSELSKILSYTQRIADNKTTMPILVNLLLTAENGALKISATDLEVTAVAKASAEVLEEGSITVNSKTFCDVVRELPDGVISILNTEDLRIQLKTETSLVNIIGISADEYPTLPGMGFSIANKINSAQLLEMLSKTIYATSNDETRFNLAGVCFCSDTNEKKEKVLRLVATDSHRLAMITRPNENIAFDGQIIVPKKGLNELKKILEIQGDSSIALDVKDNFLIVDTEDVKLSIRVIDGEFPDYKRVIPQDSGMVAVLKSGVLAQALKRVALMVSDKGKGVKFEFSQDLLRIFSSSPELGDATEELKISYNGDPITVGYNAKYVAEMASSLKDDQNICIEIHGSTGPGKFYAEGDESYIGIVMPMRLS